MSNQNFDKLVYRCLIDTQDAEVQLVAINYEHAFSNLFTAKLLVLADSKKGAYWLHRYIQVTVTDGYREQQINGLITQVDLLQSLDQRQDNQGLYQLRVAPRLSYLAMQSDTQVYLAPEANLVAILKKLFASLNWNISYQDDPKADVMILLKEEYQRPFRCQYQETALAFMNRVLAEHGIYYYFRYVNGKEQLVITDQLIITDALLKQVLMDESLGSSDLVTDLSRLWLGPWSVDKQGLVKEVSVNGDNFARVQQLFQAKHAIVQDNEQSANFRCKATYVNEYLVDESQAKVIAELRAELVCCKQSSLASTRGYLLGVNAGDFISVKQGDNTQSYLITTVRFTLYKSENKDLILRHWNEPSNILINFAIEAIPAKVKFRPDLIPAPRMPGLFSAKIAENTGVKPEQQKLANELKLNKEGYYRVSFGFINQSSANHNQDYRDTEQGKTASQNSATELGSEQFSDLLPLARPFAGADMKMEFPVLPGTEVLLGYYGGNPDYPVILGTLPYAADGSLANVTTVGERDMTWNQVGQLQFVDLPGAQQIVIDQSQNAASSNKLSLGKFDNVHGIAMASEGLFKQRMLASGYTVAKDLPLNKAHASTGDETVDVMDVAEAVGSPIKHYTEISGDVYRIKKGSAVHYYSKTKKYFVGSKEINYYPDDTRKYDVAELVNKLDSDVKGQDGTGQN